MQKMRYHTRLLTLNNQDKPFHFSRPCLHAMCVHRIRVHRVSFASYLLPSQLCSVLVPQKKCSLLVQQIPHSIPNVLFSCRENHIVLKTLGKSFKVVMVCQIKSVVYGPSIDEPLTDVFVLIRMCPLQGSTLISSELTNK